MTGRRTVYGLGLALGGLLLTGCGDEPGLDVAAVEAFVAQSQATTFGDLEIGSASCPDRALTEGMSLPCTLTVTDVKVPYEVRLRDVHESEVRIDVTLDAVVLLADRIQDYVVSTLPDDFATAQVTCEHAVIVVEVGDTIECTLATGAQTKPVAVTVEDEEGHVSIT